jgi:endo-1,4-beta-xylanase
MKLFNKIALGLAISSGLASCQKYEALEYQVEKPVTFAEQEQINAYQPLKSYLDRTANPNFKFGAALSLSQYTDKGLMYRLVNSNFDEIVLGYEMKHGAVVQDNGSLNLANVKTLLETAKAAGMSVYGHTLMWHANQNAKYLKSLIAPVIIPNTGGPSWDLVTGADFETDAAPNYQSNTNAVMSFTAAGQGFNNTGRALKITNSAVRTNDYDAQLFVKFSPAVQVGEKYQLTMNVKSDVAASYSTQAHITPGAYKFYDFFGTISSTPTWTTYTKEITVTTDMATSGTIAFNLGKTATTFYFDNITVKKFNASGGTSTGSDMIANFEGDAVGQTYPMTSGGSATVATDPKGESGKALRIIGVQTFPKFTVNVPAGRNLGHYESVTLDMMFGAGVFGQGMKVSINGGTPFQYGQPSSFGLNADNTWGRGKVILPLASLNLTDAQKKLTSFTIEIGSATGAADYYIDNVKMNWKVSGDIIIEKTDTEKRTLLTNALETWIKGMLDVAKTHVKAWDVVNEPMDDGKPAELKTAAGRTNIPADNFFWQDYLGKDYALKAFQLARQYGNATDIHFINDYNLEYSLDKCRGLIEYVKYLEGKGAKIDGIGTQMHIDATTSKANIDEMFKLLAATGKLIKVSELDMGLGGGTKTPQATTAQYAAQAEMYKYVIKKYFELVPAAQRYGITIWSPLDSPASSSWRAGEPIGLWTEGYVRKPAYVGVADGLANK